MLYKQENLIEHIDLSLEVKKENEAEAVKWFAKDTEQNNSEAQYLLGRCYYDGCRVKEDKVEAVQWFSRSAEKNYPKAQYILGMCYLSGQGLEKNAAEAAKWFTKAAEQNHIEAANKGSVASSPEGRAQPSSGHTYPANE